MDDKDRDTMKVAMPWNLNWLAIGRWQWHRRVVLGDEMEKARP